MKRMLFLLVVLLFWGSNKVSSQQSILCSVTLEENIPTRFPLSFIDFNFDKNIDLVWHDENKETINVRHLENGKPS